MKHLLFLLLSCFFGWIEVNAETTAKLVIHCEVSGSLMDILVQKGHTDLSQISNLVVSGHLHAGDFRAFKQMNLDSLDISDVTIDAFYGIGTYEPGMLGFQQAKQYPANTLPITAFSFISQANNRLTGMEQLKYIALPKRLKAIANGALAYSSLSHILLPETLEEIKADAFVGCSHLEELYIPASVSIIGGQEDEFPSYNSFGRCTALKQIIVAKENQSFMSSDGVLYNKDGSILRLYPIGRTDSIYTIKEGVKRIGHHAFEFAQYLQTLTLPASLEIIERSFWGCDNLQTIICMGETPAEWYAYGAMNLDRPFDDKLLNEGWLIVPAGTKGIYEKNEFLSWGEFKHIREADETTSIDLPVTTDYQLITTNGQLLIRRNTQQPLQVTICSISGKLIYQGIMQETFRAYPIPQAGNYLIRINNNNHKLYCQ